MSSVENEEVKTKFCSSCKTEKSVADFYVCPSKSTGYYSHCISCSKEKSKNKIRIRPIPPYPFRTSHSIH